MADARALLAAERKARRISHPFLQYTKSGQPLCKVCQLNIKSEALWEGHLKSVNHRKNVKAAEAASARSLKRKLEDVQEEDEEVEDVGPREMKKPKSRVPSLMDEGTIVNGEGDEKDLQQASSDREVVPAEKAAEEAAPQLESKSESRKPPEPVAAVDEDEWAAFEHEMGALAEVDYSEATISAAPVTAEQLAKQKDEDRQKQQENNADAEKEEEERRADEEVEIMEELGERVRKLREKREALRIAPVADAAAASEENGKEKPEPDMKETDEAEDEDDDDDVDDWYS
jgi:zinc finger protein 830